jgi:hypothetical protein
MNSDKCRSRTAVDNMIGRLCQNFPFFFSQMTVPNGLIDFCPLCGGSFLGTPQISKDFKLPTFGLLDSASGLRGLLKQKCTFFLEK